VALKNYKVNESIVVYYQPLLASPGIVCTMTVYNASWQIDSAQSGQMAEMGASTGRYEKAFTPNVKGDWFVLLSDANGGKAVQAFSVGDYNEQAIGDAVAAVQATVNTINAKVTNQPMVG
jgi:hypothetical protein